MINLVISLSLGLLGALLIALIPMEKRIRNFVILLSTGLAMVFSWKVAIPVFNGERIRLAGEIGGLDFALDPDPLGAVFGLIVSVLWLFTAVYSLGYMEEKKGQRTYYVFFLAALSVTMGVAYSGNLIALYLFYELLTFTTYPLVIHERTKEAMKAGAKYMIYSLSGAGAILAAILITYGRTGNFDFSGSPILKGQTGGYLNGLLLLFVLGFGVKAALMPFHRWLPSAMVAPTPVSALLHAVAVVFSGAYGILRTVYSVFGHELVKELAARKFLIALSVFTILAGVIIALRQDVLKRRLAYQTISHVSYIMLGALTLQPLGLAGAVMHMMGYSVSKITLFFCAGMITEQTGETRMSRMKGVGHRLPKTMIAFGIGALGMIGILPLSTFWGKYYLMRGSVSGGFWPLAAVLILSGLLNVFCFIPFTVKAFLGERPKDAGSAEGKALFLLLPILVLTAVALFTGFFPGILWPGVEASVRGFF